MPHLVASQLQEPSWYGVLNSTYSRLRPQLQVSLTLEEEGQSSTLMTLPSRVQETHDSGRYMYIAWVCDNCYTPPPSLSPSLCLSLSLSLSLLPSPPSCTLKVPSLSLTLDPSGGYYHLLPSPHSALKPDHEEHQLMYTLSLTLSNAKQLPNVRQSSAAIYTAAHTVPWILPYRVHPPNVIVTKNSLIPRPIPAFQALG